MTTRKKPAPSATVELPERSTVPDRFKWNPEILFASPKDWEAELARVIKAIPGLKAWQGRLGESAAVAAECLSAQTELHLRLERLDGYASRLYDTDVRRSPPQAMTEKAEKAFTDYLSATAYLEPELLALPEATLAAYAADPLLRDHDRYLRQLLRLREHVLTRPEETILAGASTVGMTAYNVYKTFTNGDLEYPTFVDQEGRTVVLSPAMYSRYRQSPHREERREVFERFWGAHRTYRNTFSRMLSGQMAYHDFLARTRRYPDALSAALEPNAVPPAFYPRLIEHITAHLGAFHRYLEVRRTLLGIDGDQHYHDLYPMPVKQGQRAYPFERSRDLVIQAVKPLGPAYQQLMRQAVADGSGWLDVLPNQGKRSGAYSSGVFGHHPLVLLNHTDDFDSLSTLAHELGHALHSALSNAAQPYPKADYSLFNAEVASTFNETLLIEHLLRRERSPGERRFLLAAYLDSFRGTVFRQTMFAEFELECYRRVKARRPLTADALSRLYLGLLRRYHGHAEGVMKIDPLYGIEWAFIPHFYYNFYVYQYVSGFVAATALAQRVLERGAPAARQYVEKMLQAGSAKDPIEILSDAGVDMMSPEPYAMAIRRFTERTEELARLGAG
jgi:oligoendopeptidase F